MSPSVKLSDGGITSPIRGRKLKKSLWGGLQYGNILKHFSDCHVVLPSQEASRPQSAERILWIMVLADAAHDIVRGKASRLREVEHWMDPDSPYKAPIDFALCCDLAGLEADYVRSRFTRAIATTRYRQKQGVERHLDRRTRTDLRHPQADVGGRSRFGHAQTG
jgi:hypothetical protein